MRLQPDGTWQRNLFTSQGEECEINGHKKSSTQRTWAEPTITK